MKNAGSLKKRDLAVSAERVKQGQHCGRLLAMARWQPGIKASQLKGENFLLCFCSSFPFHLQIASIYICPRNHLTLPQT